MTTTKIASLTKEALENSPITNGIQLINTTSVGFEIIDRRDLRERLYNPIRGRGVKRTFGATHFVVTKSLFEKLTK